MTAYEAIQASFKALLCTKPLKAISVDDICQNAYVSRKTFYMYFSSKFNLIDKIFMDDIVNSLNELRKLLPSHNGETTMIVLVRFYKNFYNNRVFYKNLLEGKGQYWFRERLIDELTRLTKEAYVKNASRMSPMQYDYLCYFCASSQTMLLSRWLKDGCKMSPQEIADCYYHWQTSYWMTLDNEQTTAF